jgi:hypothetical protein
VDIWLGVIAGEGDGLGNWSAGSSVAGTVSNGCVASLGWAVGLSVAGGVTNRQPQMTRTTVRQINKCTFLFIVRLSDWDIMGSLTPLLGKVAKFGICRRYAPANPKFR